MFADEAAESTPDALLFKIPRGSDPALGYVDVSCAEAAAIVSRLAAVWSTRLSDLGLAPSEKTGLIIAIAVEPCVHAFFHHLAFWALGCCLQYFETVLQPSVIGTLLKNGGSAALLYSADNLQEMAQGIKGRLNIPIIAFPEEEQALCLVVREKEGNTPAPPWPAPRRPTPSVIIHSSSSTSNPKLIRLSLQYWAQSLDSHSELITSSGLRNSDNANRIRLIVSSPSWHTFNNILVLHLATRAPVAFAQKCEIASLTPAEILDWLVVSKAGQIVTPALHAREMLRLAFESDGTPKHEEWARALKGLDSLGITGSDIDSALSDLLVKCNVKAINLFGTSELGGLLKSDGPPYHFLHPYPDIPPPIAIPFSEAEPSMKYTFDSHIGDYTIVTQPQLVQLWTLVSSHPRLAHMVAENNAPLKIESYPGPGPAHGQPATKWSDLFYEFKITRGSNSEPETIYVHAGRTDDFIRLSSNEGINASEVELALGAAIRAKMDNLEGWELDVLQVFGTNQPRMALVVQLRQVGEGSPPNEVVASIRTAVNSVNQELGLIEEVRLDPQKRLLVVTDSGECLNDSRYSDRFKDPGPTLSTTHKHTTKRWINVEKFDPWLEQICGCT
ncbi:AMP binding enzyme [Ceratobasidium sp. AG-Ba]|nr:AMP binding enzyme [Ceratobasidium sp. AG-Ba]